MKIIDLFEKAINGKDGTQINATLMTAYCNSKEYGLAELNFDEVIWQDDIDSIVNTCRRAGIHTFTISSPTGCLLDVLYELQNRGCNVDGMERITMWYGQAKVIKAAIKIKI